MVDSREDAWRWAWLVAAAIVIGAAFIALGGLNPELRKDERFYWPAAELFSREWIPSIQTMRASPVLTTPLSMIVWGWLERITGEGLVLGRALNAAAGVVTIALIALDRRVPARRAILASAGLFACPYFVGVVTHLYSDPMAVLLVVAGTSLHARGRWIWAAVAFAGAIATRQYAVAFPAAAAGFEFLRWARETRASRAGALARSIAWIAPALAASTILAWIAALGGLAPAGSSAEHHVTTATLVHLIPRNALYHLSCIGAYFVALELFLDRSPLRNGLRRSATIAGIAAISAAFVAFPPRENLDYTIPTMGYLDKALRAVLSDGPRLVVLGILACLAMARFSAWSMSAAMVLCSALIMTKAHFAWDKFALPLLGALWTLKAASGASGNTPRA